MADLEAPLNPIRFTMNPKGYGGMNDGVQAQGHEGRARRPHFLGITL